MGRRGVGRSRRVSFTDVVRRNRFDGRRIDVLGGGLDGGYTMLLNMAGPLVVCVACTSHVLTSDKACPHCGASLRDGRGRVLGRTTTAVLMGLALAGCPSDDDTNDSMGSGASSSSTGGSGPGTSATPTTGTTDDSGSTALTFDDTSGAQSAYGTPDTETFGSTDVTDSETTSSGGDRGTDTDTGTDTGSTGSDTDLGTTSAGSSDE